MNIISQSYRITLKPVGWFLLCMITIMIISGYMWQLELIREVAGYTSIHTFLETISIVVSILVFGICWDSHTKERPGNFMLLGCVFLGVALLDCLHFLSFPGMPDFITPNTPEKTIDFWLAARLLAVLGFLGASLLPWRPLRSERTRWLSLAVTLLLVTIVTWVVLFHPELTPPTFIEGQGLTTYKVVSEYALIALYIGAALRFLQAMRTPQPYDVVGLFAAVSLMAMSEVFFTLYTNVNDAYALLGHIYKIMAYGFIYKSIFSDNINAPYQRLNMAKEELQVSEDRMNSVLASAGAGIYAIDKQGICLFCNPSASQFLGYSNPDELIGKDMHNLIHHHKSDGTPIPITECSIHATINNETPHSRDDQIFWREDGTYFPVEFRATPLYRKGESVGATVSFVDITERRQSEEILRRSQKMDAIGQLTGGISHDFNNLLGVILGNLELLEMQMSDDDKAHKRVESIKKAGQRAANLTKQLLGFSRLKAERLSVTDINRVIGEMESLITRSLTPEVEVERQLADDLWLVDIDPGDFQDALLNLSINARDAMASHGHLTIETRNTTLDTASCAQIPDAKPGQYVQLSISDSGEGIPAENLEHIFEPFYTTKEQDKGTGLGLAMVYGFVKRSGGYIKVYSEPGIGTTFHLYLPRAEGEENPTGQNGAQTEALPRGTETLLVVDDEFGLLELARESLEMLGYRVQTANDGHQALEQLSKEPTIALLFSDVVMPGGINGYKLAELATNNCPDLKVLLTSGYTEKAVAHNGQAHFQANLLSKPYTLAELAKRVRAILDEQGKQ